MSSLSGQRCAVQSLAVTGLPITQYIYDGMGARIGKGTLSAAPANSTSLCAPPLSSGFTITARYLVDLGGNQVTELNTQNGTASVPLGWAHSNVFSAARLTATYDTSGLHYALADPLGTKRIQANISGQIEESCISLPFGDALNCTPTALSTADDATEHHFTQKERDAESNNDYFFARYYNSAIGRFTTPDWSAKEEPVPYAKLDDPQSLNLYVYVGNNPLGGVDADGHLPEWLEGFGRGIRNGIENIPHSCVTGDCLVSEPKYSRTSVTTSEKAGEVTFNTLTIIATSFIGGEETAALRAGARELLAAEKVGTLTTLGEASRLSAAELSTGERFAAQSGLHLSESTHEGAEFVDAAGKTYDAMGQPAAYAHWNEGQFMNSIQDHLNKSVDFVAIDLKGASKDQTGAIKNFVGGLSKEAQARINYVH